jgi:hypothetical protein
MRITHPRVKRRTPKLSCQLRLREADPRELAAKGFAFHWIEPCLAMLVRASRVGQPRALSTRVGGETLDRLKRGQWAHSKEAGIWEAQRKS